MNYNMAEDAIKDAIANRRLAKQPYDAGLEEALEIILTPITELPDVQRLIVQIHQLDTENKQMRVAIEQAKIKRGQYREIIEALLVPTNFIGIEAAREYILEALESYGLAEVSKP